MFTGIVADCCSVSALERSTGKVRFTVRFPDGYLGGAQQGTSISIDGVCLTAAQIDGDNATFDAIDETLRLTTIGSIEVGQRVNVERSARIGDEIGGHNITGHVMCMGDIVKVESPENNHVVTFRVPAEITKYLIYKDFIALDGTSLTLADIDRTQSTFSVWFIPETLRRTTFGFKASGDRVNVEIRDQTQVIIDTIERVLPRYLPPSQEN